MFFAVDQELYTWPEDDLHMEGLYSILMHKSVQSMKQLHDEH